MSNKNLEAFEQMRKLTKEAKKFYADNYNPGSLYPPRDTKFFLNEEYIPFDFETDYDDPLYKEYRRVRMLKNPFEDEKEQGKNFALSGVNESQAETLATYPSSNAQASGTEPYLEFDGNSLKWIEDGSEKYKWKAMSGADNYQNRMYQARKGQGPLPEGEWNVRQNQLQHFDDATDFQKFLSRYGRGQWPNGTSSWGNHRVWIDPAENTHTYGRGGLAIHGGNTFGSNGCIDLEGGMDDFNDKYSTYGKDMRLKVKYPQDF